MIRLDFREMREMLRAMQAGELTVSRGIEILEMWSAGNWNDAMLPPVRHDLIEQDSMPVEIIDRLKARVAELEAQSGEAVAEFVEDQNAVGGARFRMLKPIMMGARLYLRAPQAVPETCNWKLEDKDWSYWESDCGMSFTINDGTPSDNDMTYCPKCGKKIAAAQSPEGE